MIPSEYERIKTALENPNYKALNNKELARLLGVTEANIDNVIEMTQNITHTEGITTVIPYEKFEELKAAECVVDTLLTYAKKSSESDDNLFVPASIVDSTLKQYFPQKVQKTLDKLPSCLGQRFGKYT